MSEYITIPAFAERAGVTRQAVYKRIDRDLKTFVKLVDNKKLIDTSALSLFKQTETTATVDQQIGNQTTETVCKLLTEQVNQLSNQLAETVDMLRAEQVENRKLTEQLIALSTDFSELAKQSNLLLSQSQALQGHIQQRTLGRQPQDGETTVDDVDGIVNEPEVTVDQKEGKPRGNWFTRMFG